MRLTMRLTMRLMESYGLFLGSLSLASLLSVGCDPRYKDLLDQVNQGNGSGPVEAPPEKPSQPTAGAPDSAGCMTYDWGISATCMTYADAKQNAMATCGQLGMEVKTQTLTEECADGGYRHLAFTCCKVELLPSVPDGCQVFKEGSATDCKSSEEWRQGVASACQGLGLQISSLMMGDLCGENSYRYAQYDCCQTVAPPPPPSVPPPSSCVTKLLDGSCQSADLWKQQATSTCQAAGLELTYYETPVPCADGTFSEIKFDCCKLDANGKPI